jgi:site-specific DNA recombinase
MTRKRRAGDPGVAVAYVRVSTEDQRLGPEAQRAAVELWAAREGIRVAAWCVDQGVSGAKPVEARPALLSAIAALGEHGAGLLLVAKRDRIARDVVIAATAERLAADKGARLVSAAGEGNGDTPADQFMKTVIDGAAQYERGLIRARTKAALAAKKAKGERVGVIPFGYRVADDGARLEQDPHEQAVLATVFELRDAGLTQHSIVAELALRGVVSRRGRPLAQPQVCRLLARRA